MRAIAAGLTDIGRERNHNEDRFILLPEFDVYVVADGMGGHQSGEVASRMAASTIASYFRAGGPGEAAKNERLRDAVCDANAKIFSRADDSRAHRGMGTTVVAAAYDASSKKMHFANAGDSRAYQLRGDNIKQLTRDHSLLSDALLERPELTESDLAYLPKNVITRALGIAPTVDVDLVTVDVEVGDVYLLCSDGLHGLVDDPTMRNIVRESSVLTEACARLVEAANKNGGKDNITAVLVRVEETDQPWSQRSPTPIGGAAPATETRPTAAAPSAPDAPGDTRAEADAPSAAEAADSPANTDTPAPTDAPVKAKTKAKTKGKPGKSNGA